MSKHLYGDTKLTAKCRPIGSEIAVMTSSSSSGASSVSSKSDITLSDEPHFHMALDKSMSELVEVIGKWTSENQTSLLLALALNLEESFDTSKVDQNYFRRSVF